jgi:aspartate racemase
VRSLQFGVLGLGAYSTAFYVRRLHELYHARNKQYSTCPFLMHQVDFHPINSLLPKPSAELTELLRGLVLDLKAYGELPWIIPNITLHEHLLDLCLEEGVRVIDPFNISLSYLNKGAVKTVEILGTTYTMNNPWILQKFAESKWKVIAPEHEVQLWVDDLRKKVYSGEQSAVDIKQFQEYVAARLNPKEGHVLILACTELSVAAASFPQYPAMLDLASLQIESALDLLND